MTVYGFKEKEIAEKLRDLAVSGTQNSGSTVDSESSLRKTEKSPHQTPRKRTIDFYLAVVTEEISAASIEDDGGTDKLILGTGKVALVRRILSVASNSAGDGDEFKEVGKTPIKMSSGPDQVYEETVYNYEQTKIPVSTGSGGFAESTVIHKVVRDNYGDLYILPPDAPKIYLGQSTTAVTPSTSNFTLTNLTQFPEGEPPTSITVKNTQNMELNAGDKIVFAIELSDGTYETWGPSGGGGTGGGTTINATAERFEMTSDKSVSDITGEAKTIPAIPDYMLEVPNESARYMLGVDEDPFTSDPAVGDIVKQTFPLSFWKLIGPDASVMANWEEVSTEGEDILIIDPTNHIVAYGPYTDFKGNSDVFRGIGLRFTNNYDNTGKPGYYVLEIDELMPFVYATVRVEAGFRFAVPFEGNVLSSIEGVGSGTQYKYPKQKLIPLSGTNPPEVLNSMEIIDRYQLAGLLNDAEEWAISKEPKSDNYNWAHRIGGGGVPYWRGVLVANDQGQRNTITAASHTDDPDSPGNFSLEPGTGSIYKLVPDGLLGTWIVEDNPTTVYNYYSKEIEAIQAGKAIVVHVLDDVVVNVDCNELPWVGDFPSGGPVS